MNSQPLQNFSPVAVVEKLRAHHRRDDNDHRSDQRLPFTQHQSGAGAGANKLSGHHHKAGSPDNLPADNKQQQAADVRGGVEQFGVGRRLRQVKPGEGDKRQRIKRTGAGAEKTVVKPDAAAGDQRKRQTVEPTLPVRIPPMWCRYTVPG